MFSCLAMTQADCRQSSERHLLHRIPTQTLAVVVFLVVQVVVATQPVNADQVSRPNIVLIMADDMGYECLSANGSLDYRTPNLDRLAAEGLRFTHCYAQPICTPSRVKLMTGKSNKRNYVRFGRLARDQVTFAQLLQGAGYRTCIAGKWQLGNEEDAPQHFGFQQSLLWQHTRGRSDAMKHDTRYPNPRLERNGVPTDFSNGEFSADVFVDFIGKFMTENRDRPFLVYYPMALVHCPFCPTPDSEDWDPMSRGSKTYKGDPQYFGDMVAYADKTVGRIDAKLKELGIRDNTLLMFIGDNGTDTPIVTNTTYGRVVGAKGKMVDGGNHVPCVISWPGTSPKGKVIDDIVDFSDFLPTLCDATGTDVPTDLVVDGRSFLPQLQGKQGNPRQAIYMWYSRNGVVSEAKVFARNQRYKLYSSGKFYDVPNDPEEKHPLAIDQLTAEQQEIHRMLEQHIAQFDDIQPVNAAGGTNRKRRGKSN